MHPGEARHQPSRGSFARSTSSHCWTQVSAPPGLTLIVNHQLVPAARSYQIDPAQAFADFTAQHLMVGHVRRKFTHLTVQITVAEDSRSRWCRSLHHSGEHRHSCGQS